MRACRAKSAKATRSRFCRLFPEADHELSAFCVLYSVFCVLPMQPHVIEKLKQSEARYGELAAMVADPAVQSDGNAYRKHTKEMSELQPLVEGYQEFLKLESEIANAREMAASGDPDMAGLANEELPGLESRLEALEQEVKILLVPKDPNDDKNVMLEIRAGTGGDEAALFAADLFRMYSRF